MYIINESITMPYQYLAIILPMCAPRPTACCPPGIPKVGGGKLAEGEMSVAKEGGQQPQKGHWQDSEKNDDKDDDALLSVSLSSLSPSSCDNTFDAFKMFVINSNGKGDEIFLNLGAAQDNVFVKLLYWSLS